MRRLIKYAVIFATVAMCSTLSQAADVILKITRISVDDNVYTPYYSADTERAHNQGSAQRWIRLAVEYSTSGGWIDELTINHMAIVHPHDSEEPIVLAEEVTYIHIGPGRHFSYVYMHPNCVKCYKLKASRIDGAMTFSSEGEIVASDRTTRKYKDDWTLNNKYDGHLLRESETPFQFINYDFKEIIKHRHQGE